MDSIDLSKLLPDLHFNGSDSYIYYLIKHEDQQFATNFINTHKLYLSNRFVYCSIRCGMFNKVDYYLMKGCVINCPQRIRYYLTEAYRYTGLADSYNLLDLYKYSNIRKWILDNKEYILNERFRFIETKLAECEKKKTMVEEELKNIIPICYDVIKYEIVKYL